MDRLGEPSNHANAARLKIALMLALALGMTAAAYMLYELAMQAHASMQEAGQAQIDASSDFSWIDLLVWLLLIPVFGKALLVARKLPWGTDHTWSQGQWAPSDPMALHPGAGAPLAPPLRQSLGSKKIGLGVMGAIAGMALLGAVGAGAALFDDMAEGGALSPLPLLPLLGALAFAGVVAYAGLVLISSRIVFDNMGICESDFFRARRLPWSAVRGLRLGGADAYPQRSGEDADDGHWLLVDAQGQTLMRIANDMTPAPSLADLRARLAPGPGLQIEAAAREIDESEPSEDLAAAMDAMKLKFEARHRQFDRDFGRTGLIGMLVVLALFLLPALFVTYQALWFMFAAEQAQGQVVEVERVGAEGAQLSSLIVHYQPAGQAADQPLRIQSDGMRAYEHYQVGDRLRVFYNPQRPEDARLDLFWELWIGPVVLGALAAIMGLITALIARSIKPRRGA